MSDTTASLQRKMNSAGDLQSVVRTMKTLAASSVGQYEKSVSALSEYARTVELGLGACFRADASVSLMQEASGKQERAVSAVVFGSDQGLVGQFNDIVADFAVKTLAGLPGKTTRVWAVGERVQARLLDAGLPVVDSLAVPGSVKTISPLVGQILIDHQAYVDKGAVTELHLFYNRPKNGAVYAPVTQRLLPLDNTWRKLQTEQAWPGKQLPEVLGSVSETLRALIGEYLFVSIFRACAESLASENASRLAAMQRADKNIDELLATLHSRFHQLRQSSIDEELFDVVSGYEAFL
jgi:F-type H+-transporting ATPase subunit gamma